MSETLRVGIVGAAGYTGAELVRLVAGHPNLELSWVGAKDRAGKTLGDAVPSCAGVPGVGDRILERLDPSGAAALAEQLDACFCALPHGASARLVAALFRAGCRVVDLSADFRLKDAATYARWYGEHPEAELLSEAVYGLPELHRLEGARLIASPGCYPTSAILPVAPLLRAGLVQGDRIIVDAKSGVSGAGRKVSERTQFSETAEGIRPYKVGASHRHVPEIEQEWALITGNPVPCVFTPHLAPMTRGILTCCYATCAADVTAERCREAARQLYADGPVTVLEGDRLPDTTWVRGSLRAHVAYAVEERTRTVIAMCAIDNLARGASAQAVAALNAAVGWPASRGLPEIGTFP